MRTRGSGMAQRERGESKPRLLDKAARLRAAYPSELARAELAEILSRAGADVGVEQIGRLANNHSMCDTSGFILK